MENGQAFVDALKLDLHDVEDPPFISDEEYLRFMNDAQNEFCRRTDGIRDATSPLTQISIGLEDPDFIKIDQSILKIRQAYRADNGCEIDVLNAEDMPRHGYRWNGIPGRARCIVIGEERGKVRSYPVSDAAFDVNLVVFRLAKPMLLDSASEIPEEYHEGLMKYAKHRAYSKQDGEIFNKTKAREELENFLAFCAEAQASERRRNHKPRTIAYGGI